MPGLRQPRNYSDHQQTETTGRNDTSSNRGDSHLKKVSFDAVADYGEDSIRQKPSAFSHAQNRHPEDDYRNENEYDNEYEGEAEGNGNNVGHADDEGLYYNSAKQDDRYDTPKGNQFSTFSVSFGRTESHQRSLSPPIRDVASILDVPIKGRVDHLMQSYDVVKGEDRKTKALREKGFIQYKVVPESVSNSGLKKSLSFESKKFGKASSRASEKDPEERDNLISPQKQ